MAWLKSDGVAAMVGSLIVVVCAGLTYRGVSTTSPAQLHIAPSTHTALTPSILRATASVERPLQQPLRSSSDVEVLQEVDDGVPSREQAPAAQQVNAWGPLFGLASAFFAVSAAALTVVRPKAPQPEGVVEVDLESAPLQGSRRHVLAGGVAGAVVTAVTANPQPATAGLFGGEPELPDWEQVDIPGVSGEDITFYDLTMLDDKRGFLIGSRQTFLETNDGGLNWVPRTINTQDEQPYRFASISFAGDEGWMVGKPPILMHTTNGGKDWDRVGLSSKLPGIPLIIRALGPGAAEMCTDQGGLYVTDNTAQSWKAAVEETVDATLNRTVSSGISGASYYTGSFGTIARNDKGQYIGVSSRGNFFMTWEPGQTFWMPHNRAGARRIQSMGWRPDGGIWEIGRGGQLSFGKGVGIQEEVEQLKINSRGYGLLDVAWRKDDEIWTVGGSGTLIKSVDGGQKWTRQRGLDDVAANLYEVNFFNNGKTGFVLGNNGVLLRFVGK